MDSLRAKHLEELFHRSAGGLHALVCRLPENVVMLTGYQPILGNSFCLVSLNQAGSVEMRLAVPSDEKDLVPEGAAVEVATFTEETMETIEQTTQAVHEPFARLIRSAHLNESAIVGYEGGLSPAATAYTQVGIPGPATLALLHQLFLGGNLRDASAMLQELAAVKTEEELSAIRRCEEVGRQGFLAAREAVHVGATEADIAAAASAAMLRAGYALPGIRQVLPHAHVMAGSRAALAYRAFNLTAHTTLRQGDPVVVQMEIGLNGYWAELTRTFFVDSLNDTWRNAYQACITAREAALHAIRDGARARAVDEAARQVLTQAGFGDAFKHGLGHGFGFQAINHSARPILHPASDAVLRSRMVHNLEPAVYLDGQGGVRLNENVAVQRDGCEVLSSAIPYDLDWLLVA